QSLPERDHDEEDDDRGQPVAQAPPDAARGARRRCHGFGERTRQYTSPVVALRAEPSPWPAASASRTVVTSSKKCASSLVATPLGCGRSIGTISEMRPGRADMTTTRVDRNTASGIECVTKTIV